MARALCPVRGLIAIGAITEARVRPAPPATGCSRSSH
jgi:hypothetical protein